MSPFYVVTDCEFDGPTPGINSMLSFGSVAVAADGAIIGEFEAVLAPLDGALRDEATMAFWARHPQAWAAATENPEPAAAVMRRFVDWIGAIEGEPIFASHPLALDGPWFDYYLRRFIGRPLLEGPWVQSRIFKHAPLCLMSFVAGKTGGGAVGVRCRALSGRMAGLGRAYASGDRRCPRLCQPAALLHPLR